LWAGADRHDSNRPSSRRLRWGGAGSAGPVRRHKGALAPLNHAGAAVHWSGPTSVYLYFNVPGLRSSDPGSTRPPTETLLFCPDRPDANGALKRSLRRKGGAVPTGRDHPDRLRGVKEGRQSARDVTRCRKALESESRRCQGQPKTKEKAGRGAAVGASLRRTRWCWSRSSVTCFNETSKRTETQRLPRRCPWNHDQ